MNKLYLSEDLARRGLIFKGCHLPYNPNLLSRARELRKNMTPAEKKLWFGFLRDFRIRFIRQHPIDHYIVDFFCPRLMLAIEIDGEQHYTEEGKQYDSIRDEVLSSYGVTVLRVGNGEVMEQFPLVCKRIENCAVDKTRDESGFLR
jgi:very-short-patch-repair endonuclease